MNTSAVVADQLREASFVKREAFSLRIRTSHDYSPRFTRNTLADPPCPILPVIDRYDLS